MVFDVTESEFQQRVVERSREVPVVVDFWAAWCGPCRALTPALEAAATAREGQVDLAKVDVDQNQALAAGFRVQGIPSVKAFRGGEVVDEFTGALPPPQVEAFFDRLVPSEADRLAGSRDEASLRRALELDPRHTEAARELGRRLVGRGEWGEAVGLLEPFEQDWVAAGLLARARMEDGNGDASVPIPPDAEGAARAAFAAWDEGDRERALDLLQEAIRAAPPEDRDQLRQIMVAIFTELGPDSPVARDHRRRLAAALN
jgi:putative thioredoxin